MVVNQALPISMVLRVQGMATMAESETWYLYCMVNLTTRTPDFVAAILDETLPPEVTLFDLAAGTPVVWEDQWGRVGGIDDSF